MVASSRNMICTSQIDLAKNKYALPTGGRLCFCFRTICRSGFFKCKTWDSEMRGLNYDSLKWSKTVGNMCKTWDLKMHGLDADSLRWQESFGHMCRTWDLGMRGLNYDSLTWSKTVGNMCKTWDLKMHGPDADSLRWQESFGHMCRTWDLKPGTGTSICCCSFSENRKTQKKHDLRKTSFP